MDDATLEAYIDNVTEAYSTLERVYDKAPQAQYILLVVHQMGFIRPDALTVPFGLSSEIGIITHETAHWFTHRLHPTHERWLDEGISIVFGLLAENAIHVDDLKIDEAMAGYRDSFPTAYGQLKSGVNIFKVDDGWLNAHNVGHLFLVALAEDYGIDGGEVGAYLRFLENAVEDNDSICFDDLFGYQGESAPSCRNHPELEIGHLLEAAEYLFGRDIQPLLDLLEPGIKYNSYWDEERVSQFFSDNPQYDTDDVSWITSTSFRTPPPTFDDVIENADRSIRIEYFYTPGIGEKERDLEYAQRAVDFLAELFATLPPAPISN